MPMDPIRTVQYITHASPPPMFVPVADPSLSTQLVNQIDYYFRYSYCLLLFIGHLYWNLFLQLSLIFQNLRAYVPVFYALQ